MERLSEQIMERVERTAEGTPIAAKGLLHLGSRAAVDQALSRLRRRGQLLRAGRGLYVRPVESRFGTRPPSVEAVVEAIAAKGSETIVPSGAASANKLGLTTQNPVRQVYLTSGTSREYRLGNQVVELKHAPKWQLAFPGRPAGEALRALSWAGPAKAHAVLGTLEQILPSSEFQTLTAAAHLTPSWLSKILSSRGEGG